MQNKKKLFTLAKFKGKKKKSKLNSYIVYSSII